MGTFVIPTYNPLSFKDINSLQSNFENTLSKNEQFDGVVNARFNQKFIASDNIRVQFFADYDIDLTDTITATLIGQNESNIVIEKIKQVSDPEIGESIFYEFDITGQALGVYTVAIKATRTAESNIYYESEPFEIVESIKEYRYANDGTKFEIETIENHVKITAFNNENQQFTYWGSDRITGEPFEVNYWVEGTNRKPQPSGEVDNYDNQGQLTKLKSIAQRVFELKTADIASHLALKVSECSDLDNFYVNDIQFVTEEKSEIEYFGNYTSGVLTLNLTQSNVSGLNSDDQGFGAIMEDTDMSGIQIKKASSVSGSTQLVVTGGYTINLIALNLVAGTSATVKIGTTPSGDEILMSTTLTNSTSPKYIGQSFGNPSDVDTSFTAYIEVVGVGAAMDVILQTIKNTQ